MNRLAYSPFNKDEPRTVEGLSVLHAKAWKKQNNYTIKKDYTLGHIKIDIEDAYTAGYSQAAEDAAAEITRLTAELKLAHKKIQELR